MQKILFYKNILIKFSTKMFLDIIGIMVVLGIIGLVIYSGRLLVDLVYYIPEWVGCDWRTLLGFTVLFLLLFILTSVIVSWCYGNWKEAKKEVLGEKNE